MNDALKRMNNTGVVPVVVIENSKDAVPAANAMLAGGVDIMEITLRTDAGLDSIRSVAAQCPDVLVGAGTVLTLEQCKQCVEAGAKFIVSPGFNKSIVEWCLENDVAVVPGCVTPTEITVALEMGLKILKFFPANVYGGLSAMKALAATFGDVKFIPTGGVGVQNLDEFITAPFIHAVGGSWICKKDDIASGEFEKITALCAEATRIVLGFEFAHLGINTEDTNDAYAVSNEFNNAFGLPIKDGNASIFASAGIEVIKGTYLGTNGHIAIRTNSIARAVGYVEERGYTVDAESEKYIDGKLIAIYLHKEFGKFAIHLLQK